MNIDTIKEIVNTLSDTYAIQEAPTSWRDKVELAWRKQTLAKIKAILADNAGNTPNLIKALQGFLNTNWALTNGTPVGYTALPRSDVTQLLMHAAQFIAAEEDKKGCAVVSMPFVPTRVSEVALGGLNSACIRIKGKPRCLLLMDSIPTDAAQIDMGNFDAGYVRVKNSDVTPNIDALYFIDKQSGRCQKLAMPARWLVQFDQLTQASKTLGALPVEALEFLTQKLPGHPPIPDSLYYANQQKNELIKLQASPEQLQAFDTSLRGESPIDNFSLDAIPECCGNLVDKVSRCNPIKLLMPTVSLASHTDRYQDLGSGINVLSTHVLGDAGEYLLPIQLLAELDLSDDWKRIENPYNPEKYVDINSEEGKRLVAHSPLTQAVFDAQRDYVLLTSDTSTLLGQLKQLCDQLGVYMSGALGEETNAGSGAYPAIINFMEYYNKLGKDEQKNIPEKLQVEITTLLNLTSNSSINNNATENLSTCIATRRNRLLATMSGHDEILNQISVSSIKKDSLIAETRARFEAAQQELAQALSKPTDTKGHDVGRLTLSLLEALHLEINITSLSDLDIIKSLTPEEITEVCKNADVSQQIMTQMGNLENLVTFSMETSPDKLKAFLRLMGEDLIKAWLHSSNDIVAFLISLDVEKCQVIFETMREHLKDIIKTVADFKEVLKHLSPEQRMVVYEGMKEHLKDIIKTVDEFEQVLSYLSVEQRMVVFEGMKEHLKDIIKTGRGFGDVLSYLSIEQRIVVFEGMKEQFKDIISTADDVEQVLRYLSIEQRIVVFESMNEQFKDIIASGHDFVAILRYLPPEQCMAVFEGMKEQLKDIINTGRDFGEVLRCLSPEQCTVVCEGMKEQLKAIIKTARDFVGVLSFLSSEQRTAVCEGMKEHLKDIIKTARDFGDVLRCLSPEQCTAVCEGMKEQLKDIIKTARDFGDVRRLLSSEQRTAVFEGMKEHLRDIIKTGGDFAGVLSDLSIEQRTAVYEGMKEHLKDIIKTADDVEPVLRSLSPEQCTAVCEGMKDQLKDIIKTGSDFEEVLMFLSPEQCTAVCEGMKEHLTEIFTTVGDFERVLDALSLPEPAKIDLLKLVSIQCESNHASTSIFKNRLENIIKNEQASKDSDENKAEDNPSASNFGKPG